MLGQSEPLWVTIGDTGEEGLGEHAFVRLLRNLGTSNSETETMGAKETLHPSTELKIGWRTTSGATAATSRTSGGHKHCESCSDKCSLVVMTNAEARSAWCSSMKMTRDSQSALSWMPSEREEPV